jgi:glutamate dehydrogenase (NAD(P)+)
MNIMSQRELLPPVDQDAEQAFDPYLLRLVELERAARALDLEDPVLEQMRHAELEATIHLPGGRADGAAAGLTALQCLCAPSSPAIVEFAIAPDAYLNQVRASALLNDLSCALLRLNWRGGGAGLIFDASQYSERETRRLLRRYGEAVQRILPDCFAVSRIYGGNSAIHGWLGNDLRQFSSRFGVAVPQAEAQWERLGRWIAELTRAFAAYVPAGANTALAGEPGHIEIRTCAIQGCAGLGMAAARALSGTTARREAETGSKSLLARFASRGAQVVMMSDSSGAVFNEAGLDLARLEAHVAREQVLFGYSGGEHAYGADLPLCECDLLVLQAPMQVTARNADGVRAKMVVECVPDGASYDAKTRLAANGVEVIPEVLVRCGPVLLAAADSQAWALPESRLPALLRQSARQLRAELAESARAWNTSLARAALMLAVERRATQIRRAGL